MRAITTAHLLAREIGYAQERVVIDEHIYEASVQTLRKIISQPPATCDTLMLVGHNPGLTAFASYISDFDADNVPTSRVVGIQFAMDNWKNMEGITGKLLFFHYPKEFT